jgi:GMP synthase (glutamine-hydrolysing)
VPAARKSAVVLRHLPFEDLGSWNEALDAAGYNIHYLEAGFDDPAAIDPLAPDLLVILGGPIGVAQQADYPWLGDEIKTVRQRLHADRPTLGICLGAQIMARALDAPVSTPEESEIGWSKLELTAAGRHSPLRHLEDVAVLHWHGDRFALPAGAERLASTTACPTQAFRLGRNVLAVQCHPEVCWPDLETWLIAHVRGLKANGIDVTRLRAACKAHSQALVAAGRRLLDEWLAGLA